MSYECVFISIFLLIALRNAIKETDAEGIKVQPLGNDAITLGLVLVFGFIIYFTVPEVKRSLNFLLLKPDSAKIGELISETRTTLSTGLITFTYYAFCVASLSLWTMQKGDMISREKTVCLYRCNSRFIYSKYY